MSDFFYTFCCFFRLSPRECHHVLAKRGIFWNVHWVLLIRAKIQAVIKTLGCIYQMESVFAVGILFWALFISSVLLLCPISSPVTFRCCSRLSEISHSTGLCTSPPYPSCSSFFLVYTIRGMLVSQINEILINTIHTKVHHMRSEIIQWFLCIIYHLLTQVSPYMEKYFK